MGANELSALLWRERELLETLLFKLEEERLILLAGNTRWLPRATEESTTVTRATAEAALARQVEASAVAKEWGLPDEPTLSQLIDAAPSEAWREVLTGHRTTLLALAESIGAARDENTRILNSAIRSIQETASGNGALATYDAHGRNVGANTPSSALLDKEL